MKRRLMNHKVTLGWAALLLISGSLAFAQEASTARRVEVTPEQAQLTAGDEMYMAFCANCHGVDAMGEGPVAESLVVAPPDLTRLTANNDGKFPRVKTLNVILGDRDVKTHGTREMPLWGEIFTVTTGSPAMARFRAYALVKYLESVQLGKAVEPGR